MQKRQNTEVRTLDIDDDISIVGSILHRNNETVYVVNSENVLLGTVTIGDYFRKAHVSKNVSELMNRHFVRVEQTRKERDSECVSMETASNLFSLIPNINEIPVVESKKLLHVLKRDKPYSRFWDGKAIRFNKIQPSLLEADKGRKLIVLGKNEISKLITKSVNSSQQIYFANEVLEFAYDDPNSYFVMVIEPRRTFAQIQRELASCNLVEGINYNLVCYKNFYEAYTPMLDAHLMYGRIHELPGFAVVGDSGKARLRIAVLGASTTDQYTNDFASWPEHLHRMLKENGIETVIYNGGHSAYSSSLELTKLIRDVIPLEPDIVISYGGIGDFIYVVTDESTGLCRRPFLHHFHAEFYNNMTNGEAIFGLQNDKAIDRFWVDNIRMMNSICREFGIKHLGVLQANPYSDGLPSKHIDANWRIFVTHTYSHLPWCDEVVSNASDENYLRRIYDNVESLIESIPYIHSFRRIFDGIDDVYYDGAHVQERGNEIVAARMYEALKAMCYI